MNKTNLLLISEFIGMDLITEASLRITQLNDYCLHKVFDYLSLDDLCAVNQSSKILQPSTQNAFRRKYQHLIVQSVTIKCENTVQFLVEED